MQEETADLARFSVMADEREQAARMPVPADEPDWLTLGQAAKYLGMAQSTIRKWSDSGRLPAFYTPGGHRRYRRSDLDQFLERGGAAAPRRSEGRRLILIVDDDDRLREFVRVNLEMEGYSVREAASAEEGLSGARRGAAGPDPARRDDAPGGRLGDAPPRAGAPRRRRDPGDHVQREGRRGVAEDSDARGARRASSESRSTRSS